MARVAGPFRSLHVAFVALALILSAAAWGAHSVRHGLEFAMAGPHAAANQTGHDNPEPDKQDGGHDHLQGMSFPLAALFDGTSLKPPPMPAAAPPRAEVATLPLRAPDPPLPDPPRFA